MWEFIGRCYRNISKNERYSVENGDWLAESIDRYDQIDSLSLWLEWNRLQQTVPKVLILKQFPIVFNKEMTGFLFL